MKNLYFTPELHLLIANTSDVIATSGFTKEEEGGNGDRVDIGDLKI